MIVFATGRSIQTNLLEKDAGLKEKYGTEIVLLKETMLDMQQLLNNPDKLVEAAKPTIRR